MSAQVFHISVATEGGGGGGGGGGGLSNHSTQKDCLRFVGWRSRPSWDLLVALQGCIRCMIIRLKGTVNYANVLASKAR